MTENARIINELVNRVEALEAQLQLARQAQVDQFQQGEDRLSVRGTFTWTDLRSIDDPLDPSSGERTHHVAVSPTWNEIFCAVAPALRAEVSTAALTRGLRDFFRRLAETASESQSIAGHATFSCDEVDRCRVQLDALGLMAKSTKRRSLKDSDTYWQLTPRGEALMVNVCALRRDL